MNTLSVFDQLPIPSVNAEYNDKGEVILESNLALLPYETKVGNWLKKWAKNTPDSLFIGERRNSLEPEEGWRMLTYAQFLHKVEQIAQGLYDAGATPERPIVILSANSVDHALVKMAAMHIGIPVTSLSVAYSMFSGKYDRLIAAVESLNPSIIYASDGEIFADSIMALGGNHQVIVSTGREALSQLSCRVATLDDYFSCEVTPVVDELFELVKPDTAAKYMLTSGSTGQSKIVVVTQRMMCSNQQMVAQCIPFIETTPPVVLDWLPWSHTFGTNHNFNMVLRNGGTLYIDEGLPTPGMIEKTAANILEVKPTLFFNVPKGYEILLPLLQNNKALAAAFFENLQMVFYAAASLSEFVWLELQKLAKEHDSEPLFTTEWGATETAPACTSVHWKLDKLGNIGVPMPGLQLKLSPNGNKFEVRVKGPNVFQRYLNDPVITADSFDSEGFYKIGDAARMADPENPSAGIIFDGRVSEDFKLSTGTWVCVATLRKRCVEALKGLVTDVLITGHDRDFLGLILFPSPGIYDFVGGECSHEALMNNALLREKLTLALEKINDQAKGSSQYIAKIVLAQSAPSIELGEVTDKGNFNQRTLLETRKDLIGDLYSQSSKMTICG
ncbi:feruloyl-CoA synthase [Marinomonas algarum]|uniref:Feruloyl-CoA synthase n=1 Tax=Marinomonas algarum TaxID=2883105 RepID=A0A9X1LFJ9_9GAMM|nr:feruloyl-CoA synthase [Marinomonas algarum]MCB5163034.1 feruloyl-CoA synthase [Marinomonas algarum]